MIKNDFVRALVRAVILVVVAIGAVWLLVQLVKQRAGPPKPQNTHNLTVASIPPGASLLVNGQVAGATPLTLQNVAEGVYGLRLERDGYKALNRQVHLGRQDLAITETLETLPAGLLTVEVQPAGAEVLLDGEFIGLTPLKEARVPAGNYELLIRKTNYEPHSAPVIIAPEAPQVFAGFELKDRVLAMLEAQVKSEPQRLTHYLDLGHYLFINDKMEAAVEVFSRGLEIAQTPLDFNGGGFNGRENMTKSEIDLELRLRREDEQRYNKEIEKHYHWQHKDLAVFRKKMDQMRMLFNQRNMNSWNWVEQAARLHLKGGNYEHAAKIYRDYIAATSTAPELPKAYTALIEVYLQQNDLDNASQVFGQFYTFYQNDGRNLERCGQLFVEYQGRITSSSGRLQLLGMAEKALRQAAAIAVEKVNKTQCLCELAAVLVWSERAREAVALCEQALRDTPEGALHEERELQLGEVLRQAGELERARKLYEKLGQSERPETRERAKKGLIYVTADETKKKVDGQ